MFRRIFRGVQVKPNGFAYKCLQINHKQLPFIAALGGSV